MATRQPVPVIRRCREAGDPVYMEIARGGVMASAVPQLTNARAEHCGWMHRGR